MTNESRTIGVPRLASKIATQPVKQRITSLILGEVRLEEKLSAETG